MPPTDLFRLIAWLTAVSCGVGAACIPEDRQARENTWLATDFFDPVCQEWFIPPLFDKGMVIGDALTGRRVPRPVFDDAPSYIREQIPTRHRRTLSVHPAELLGMRNRTWYYLEETEEYCAFSNEPVQGSPSFPDYLVFQRRMCAPAIQPYLVQWELEDTSEWNTRFNRYATLLCFKNATTYRVWDFGVLLLRRPCDHQGYILDYPGGVSERRAQCLDCGGEDYTAKMWAIHIDGTNGWVCEPCLHKNH